MFMRMARFLPPSALLLAACAAFSGCMSRRPDVILIVIDTLRNDELPWMGADPRFAPNLGRLAHEGVVFPRTYAPSPWTKPSTTTILTGLHPYRHGVNGHDDKLDASVQTIAEVFSAAGYQTAAVVSNPSLYDGGTRQGFEVFREVGRWIEHSTDRVAAQARDVIARASGERPLFLYVHFLDPHDKYVPPAQDRLFLPEGYTPQGPEVLTGDMRHFEGDTPVWKPTSFDFTPTPIPLQPLDLAYMRGLYRGELHAADRHLQAILDSQRIGRGNPLLSVVTADHGEAFYEHGMPRHGWTLHEEVLRVPLLFHGAPLQGRSLDGSRIARSMDILPTILDLVHVKDSEERDGVSLAQPPPEGGSVVQGLTCYHVQKESFIIEDPYKLIIDERFGRNELYDLQADPHETRNLAFSQPARVASMVARQQKIRDDLLSRKFATAKLEGEELRQHEEALKSLGYIK
ncbi:MAG: hypothetical protein DMF49_02880 [Acidobacteria bacterium]|nr:MAG: hypothetical protein DMF49_02880 [Acidobacteriota bacterium]